MRNRDRPPRPGPPARGVCAAGVETQGRAVRRADRYHDSFITGQPLRIKYLERALARMKRPEKVWLATGSEIVDAYQRATLS